MNASRLAYWDMGVPQIGSACKGCGMAAADWAWVPMGALLVLTHHITTVPVSCPSGRAFDRETYEPLTVEAVAA